MMHEEELEEDVSPIRGGRFVSPIPLPKKIKRENLDDFSSNFNSEENELLVDLYIDKKREWHQAFSAASKNGPTPQKRLSALFATELSRIGNGVRSIESIQERIKSMRKTASRRLSTDKLEGGKTGGGKRKATTVEPWCRRLMDSLSEEVSIKGIDTAVESGRSTTTDIRNDNEKVAVVTLESTEIPDSDIKPIVKPKFAYKERPHLRSVNHARDPVMEARLQLLEAERRLAEEKILLVKDQREILQLHKQKLVNETETASYRDLFDA